MSEIKPGLPSFEELARLKRINDALAAPDVGLERLLPAKDNSAPPSVKAKPRGALK